MEIIINNETQGQRLDRILRKRLALAPKPLLYKLMRKGVIKLNGRRAGGAEILKAGDVVRLFLSEETIIGFTASKRGIDPDAGGLDIIYEDINILVVNKPVGVLSQPDSPSMQGSLAERAALYLSGSGHAPAVANRLDKNTTGVVIIGKHPAALARLGQAFRERRVCKLYTTLVLGEVREAFEIEAGIVKDEVTNTSGLVDKAVPGAKAVRTFFRPIAIAGGFSLLHANLETGRSHQIRASLAERGLPIAGDPKYGNAEVNAHLRKSFGLRNQLLHCHSVRFDMPGLPTQEFCAGLPKEFENIIDRLGVAIGRNTQEDR